MNQKEIDKVKEVIKAKYAASIQKAETIRDLDIASLDKVLSLSKKTSPSSRTEYGSVTPAVLAAIDKAPAIFTKQDLYGLLSHEMKMENIGQCLTRLCKSGDITLKEKRYGSLPIKYTLTSNP